MAKYAMTDDETVAFAAALLGGVKWNGTIIQEDGRVKEYGWYILGRSVDREIRRLIAAKVLALSSPVTSEGNYRGSDFVRGAREIDERDWDGTGHNVAAG
jgi:hypothetical protein